MDDQVFTETLDWLAFTVPQATVDEMSPVVGGEWFEGPTGFRGYPTCWLTNQGRHGVGKLGTGAPRNAKEVHVDLSGGIVSTWDESKIRSVLAWIFARGGHVTRMDVALTSESIEAYYQGRRKEVSLASANRELAAIKHIFSWACGTAPKLKCTRPDMDRNPASAVWKEKEDNVRDEILEPAQFEDLQALSTEYLRPINLVAYATGMRWGEIVNLTWDKVDLKGGFVRLKGTDTKSGEGRSIPLDVFPGLREMFKELHKTRALHEPHVFLNGGRQVRSLKGAFMAACKGAGITNFRFHDFRHTAITNMRRAGIDLLTIMQISGHKTMVCFTRYNSFREADLKAAALKANTYLTLAHEKVAEQRREGEGKLAASA